MDIRTTTIARLLAATFFAVLSMSNRSGLLTASLFFDAGLCRRRGMAVVEAR
jgi:hypothetical protein